MKKKKKKRTFYFIIQQYRIGPRDPTAPTESQNWIENALKVLFIMLSDWSSPSCLKTVLKAAQSLKLFGRNRAGWLRSISVKDFLPETHSPNFRL